jgi:hypothetical protein
MKFKKYQKNSTQNHPNQKIGDGKSIEIELNDLPNDLTRTGASFLLPSIKNILKGSLPTKVVLLGDSGKGKSYSPFFIKHNLMGLSNEELKVRLELLSNDQNSTEEVRNKAKSILLTNLF